MLYVSDKLINRLLRWLRALRLNFKLEFLQLHDDWQMLVVLRILLLLTQFFMQPEKGALIELQMALKLIKEQDEIFGLRHRSHKKYNVGAYSVLQSKMFVIEENERTDELLKK